MSGTKHQSPDSRRQQIFLAADTVLNRVGVEGFTVDLVSEEAGIAKGTVYKYYNSKDQLLAELGVKSLSLLRTRFEQAVAPVPGSLEKIHAICKAGYRFYEEFPQYFSLLGLLERPDFNINEQQYIRISHDMQTLVMSIIEEGKAKGEIDPDLPADFGNYIIWASCLAVIQFVETKRKLIIDSEGINQREFVDTYARMLTYGMRP